MRVPISESWQVHLQIPTLILNVVAPASTRARTYYMGLAKHDTTGVAASQCRFSGILFFPQYQN